MKNVPTGNLLCSFQFTLAILITEPFLSKQILSLNMNIGSFNVSY